MITIDEFEEEMPKTEKTAKTFPLDEKILEIEKRSGYYPSMVIDTEKQTHLFYETVAGTTKELQNEILSVIKVVSSLFLDKDRVILTLNRVHELSGTSSGFDVEVITVIAYKIDYELFRQDKLNQNDFWSKLFLPKTSK